MSRYLSLAVVAIIAIIAFLTTQKQLDKNQPANIQTNYISTGTETMNISVKTNHGTITLELYPDKAPITVKNFAEYAESGFFDGTVFHRVIPGFMIQGGGFEPGMTQKETSANIKNEADNGLKNEAGTIAMARTPDPDSASSQFFINLKDNDFLNYSAPTPQGWGYAVFGKVSDGMEVVEAIAKVQTGSAGMHQDVPSEDVVIEEVKVIDKAAE